MIRTALRKRISETEDPALEKLLANINGNIGFIFCQDGTMDVAREVVAREVVPAAAKAGAVAQCNVTIPAGPSGLEPSQTSFFQALNIGTKIVKGSIEITADAQVCTAGERVTLSAQALLTKMNIRPFEYGMKLRSVFQDGAVFDAAVLDITDDVLMGKFMNGVNSIAAFGREVGIPTEAGLPHMMCSAFKNIVSTVAEIDFNFAEVEEIKAILADPAKLAAMKAGGGGGNGGAAAAGGAAPAAAAAAPEPEEE